MPNSSIHLILSSMVLGGVSKILTFGYPRILNTIFYLFGFFLQLENEFENVMVAGLVFSVAKCFFFIWIGSLLTSYRKPQRIRHSIAFTTTKTFQWRLRTFGRWASDT